MTIPANVKKPSDHLRTIEAEMEGGPVTVDYGGHTFVVEPDPMDWPAGALRAFENQQAMSAIRWLIGNDRWDDLKMDAWPTRKVDELFEKFAEAGGFEAAGN